VLKGRLNELSVSDSTIDLTARYWSDSKIFNKLKEVSDKRLVKVEQVKKKNLPAISKVRFECFHEGTSAQIMHIGPFSAEASNIQKILFILFLKIMLENSLLDLQLFFMEIK
jgi:hypothetical protein